MKHAAYILETMDQMFPDATVELFHHNHFELLVAVVLSAQTTDVAVNKVTPHLFESYPTPITLMNGDVKDIEKHIKTIGLYRNKAKNIKALSKALIENFDGQVPSNRTDLESLPGVGRKTANVVLSNAFNIPALAVDTHVQRVSIRLGFAKENDSVLVVEQKLMKKIPKDKWQQAHHQFIFFGRYHCLSRHPKCKTCPLYDICKYRDKAKYRHESKSS
ncbi:endonuclease III [Mariniplasma anaerobium]|uniref:Endonuclease III n=1 Tax=Mariniplasma anaerobium TaxID=2735436 RepID=A0A7U9XVH8_9MOLU|nr:endonuclease III [Mariniplasma anaerobium]BCR35490.1 endonuclease III [Mariniplasma anaerobium]